MFDSYNIPNLEYYNASECLERNSGTTKMLYDKNNRFYGVEAKYQMPFSLYFHLTEASNQSIEEAIKNSNIKFSIYSKPSGKSLISKTLKGESVFNPSSRDLKIDINQAEAQLLAQETYYMHLVLACTEGSYVLHAGSDGVLVIR
jgi:hypothetical protein